MFRSNVSRPKLHHHVPVFYQEGFCRDGRLWVFDRVTGKYRHDQPKNVGAKTHDYSTTDADGRKNPKVEELLGQIEDAAKPIFAKLRGGLPLTQEDRENFAYYLGFFFVRGPRFQRMLDEMSTVLVKSSHGSKRPRRSGRPSTKCRRRKERIRARLTLMPFTHSQEASNTLFG